MESPNKENSMLIDIQYIKQNRREGTPDALYIIWKNLDTKEKFVRMVEKPSMDIYFSKPDKRNFTHNKNYEHIENLDVKTVRYSAIPYAIAEDMGQSGRDIINDAFNTKDYSKIKTLYKYPYTFGSDYDIRAWYRYKWIRQFDNERVKELDKGYLDIDTGFLVIKVLLNNQIYYETSVNVTIDRVAVANSMTAVQSFFAKSTIGIASALALKHHRSVLKDEAEAKYQEHRKQRKEDQAQRDAKIIDRENKIQENYNNTWFDRYYKDYELKSKLIDKQTEFMRAQTEAAKELMKTGFVFRPQGNMMDGIHNGGD